MGKMDISSSHSRTVSKTQGHKISQPVTVPPRSTAKVQMIITKVKVSGDWGAQVRFPQKGKVWCNYRQYKCMAKYVSVGDNRYSNIKTTKQPGAGGFVFTQYVDNAFNHEQTSTVEFNEATTATASMTLGTTVSVGTEISFTEKAPVG